MAERVRVNVHPDEFEQKLIRLLAIMPFLYRHLDDGYDSYYFPSLVTQDLETTASRVISLKDNLPGVDVPRILQKRPSLLLDQEWRKIDARASWFRQRYGDENAADIVTFVPSLLIKTENMVI